MFNCNFCGKAVQTLRGYELHCKLHRNEPHCLFKCLDANCKQSFTRSGAFKAHFYRRHSVAAPTTLAVGGCTTYKCTVSMCERQLGDPKDIIAHFKEHIAEGRAVTCPVTGCTNVFKVKSSFISHMSRKHRAF